jgi:hypothetical protein
MKRKITFLAFAAKCPACGAIGFGSGGMDAVPVAPRSLRSFNIDASAMPPSPIAQRLKKCRRVT